MNETRVNPPALDALLDMATSPRRYVSVAEIAAEAGVSPQLLSMARNGQRGMSPETAAAVASALDVDVSALTVPLSDADEVDMRLEAVSRQLAQVHREFVQLYRIAEKRLPAA